MLKNFFVLFAILILAFCGTALAQKKAAVKNKPIVSRFTAEGVVYFVGGGNHITECLIKTDNNSLNFNVVEKTQMKGFNPQSQDDPAWGLGARWQVIYHDGGNELGFVADSIVYLGKVESISAAQKIAYDFLGFLANQNFKTAYGNLSADAKKDLNFNDFAKMYSEVSVDMRGRIICSHTDNSVNLLLAPHGADGGDLFQPVAIVEVGGKWLINKLGAFQETTAGCGDLAR